MRQEFTHDGFQFVSEFNDGFWEVWWDGWVCVDGETKEEVITNWPRNKQEIISDRLGDV